MDSPRTPNPAPSTQMSEISQEIARCSGENLHFDQKEKSVG